MKIVLNMIYMSGEQITNNSVETQNLEGELHSLKDSHRKKRVDINVLKSKLQEAESKEFKKNVTILSSLILGLGILGIYLSL